MQSRSIDRRAALRLLASAGAIAGATEVLPRAIRARAGRPLSLPSPSL